jgi:hypothetical protein
MAQPNRLSTQFISSSANSTSESVTVASGADVCVVHWGAITTGFASTILDSITLGGNAPISGGSSQTNGFGNGSVGVFVFDVSSLSGSQTLAWDHNGTSVMDDGAVLQATFYATVDPTSPVVDIDSTTTGGVTASVTLTGGTSNDLVVGSAVHFGEGANAAPTGSGQTQFTSNTVFNSLDIECGEENGGASVVWSGDVDFFGVAAVMLRGTTTGAQDLTATLFTDPDSFGASAVVPGAVALTGTLFTDLDSFGASAVAPGAVALTGTLFTDPDSFGASTVAPGAVVLAGTLFADPDSFGASAVTLGAQNLNGTLFADPDSFGASAVAPGAVALTGTLFADLDSFGASAVTLATAVLTGTLFDDPDSFGSSVVQPGAVELAGILFADPDSFGAASVSIGGSTVVVTGFSISTQLDDTLVWGDILPESTPGWTVIGPPPGPVWTDVAPSVSNSWNDVEP